MKSLKVLFELIADAQRKLHWYSVDIQELMYTLSNLLDEFIGKDSEQIYSILERQQLAIEKNNQLHVVEAKRTQNRIDRLQPILQDRIEVIRKANKEFTRNNVQLQQTREYNSNREEENADIEDKVRKLRMEIEELRQSVPQRKKQAEENYKKALTRMKKITRYYPLTHFLLKNSLETLPEAEILGIIGDKQPIESSELKSSLITVPSVQATRLLARLQSDGYCKEKDGEWVLSDEFYSKISQDPLKDL